MPFFLGSNLSKSNFSFNQLFITLNKNYKINFNINKDISFTINEIIEKIKEVNLYISQNRINLTSFQIITTW